MTYINCTGVLISIALQQLIQNPSFSKKIPLFYSRFLGDRSLETPLANEIQGRTNPFAWGRDSAAKKDEFAMKMKGFESIVTSLSKITHPFSPNVQFLTKSVTWRRSRFVVLAWIDPIAPCI